MIFHPLKLHNELCTKINFIPNDNSQNNLFYVIGALHVGKGHTQTTNFLSVMDIPSMSQGTFKRHERYLIPAIEEVTQRNMEEAVALERQLTLENIDEIKKYLLVD